MVSSGNVGAVASELTSDFSGYKSYVSDLQGSWQGSSFNSLLSKAEEFTGEFEGTILKQLQAFQDAIVTYESYKKVKNNLKVTESNYNIAIKNNDQNAINNFSASIYRFRSEMDGLKTRINSSLQSASSPKLEAQSISPSKGEFVNYYQTDYANVAYGSYGTISSHGCGPTSLAMVLSYLLDEEITPIQTTKDAEQGGYTSAKGTYHSYFGAMAEKYGVECRQIDGVSTNQITESLNNDKTLIMLMGPGHFTSSGHFIVIRGLDENGKAIVADPASRKRTEQTWDLSILASESSRMWEYDNE